MKRLLLFLLRVYQLYISPLKPPSCRFYPTCSHYAVEAVATHGAGRGAWLTVKRLVKCGPWHPGGYDPVPAVPDHRVRVMKEGHSACCDEKTCSSSS